MDTGLQIRPAKHDDLKAIAAIHVRVWRLSHAGLLPPEILDAADAEERLKMWEESFGEKGTSLLIACIGPRPIGFIAFGPARDRDFKGAGEIYAVYLLREAWKRGVGKALFNKAKEGFLENGFLKFYLWVLDANDAAIKTFERWGGKVDPNVVRENEVIDMIFNEALVTFGVKEKKAT